MPCNGDCNQGRECNCECKKETKMTKDEALRMAINVLELYEERMNSSIAIEVIQACKEALEQPTAEQSSLVQEPYNLVAILNDPMRAYPANFSTSKKANALLLGLCQEAADEIERLKEEVK